MIALTSGLQSAWTSPSIVAITKDKVNYNITEKEASYFTILPSAAMVLTCGFVSMSYDYFGRKLVLFLTAIPQLSSWIIVATATDVKMFYFARILSGIGEASYFSAVPAYVGEISSPKVRGTWGIAVSSLRYFGGFLINILGSYFSVSTTACICMSVPIIFLILMPFLPESPYYLIMKEREEDAKKSLSTLTRKRNVDKDYLKLKGDVDRQMSERGKWMDLVKIRSNRKGVLIAIYLRIAQFLGGLAVFNFYNQFIFDKASKSDGSAKMSSMIYAGLLCIAAFFSSTVADTIGRKKSFIFSALICGISLLLEAIYFFVDARMPDVDIGSTFLKWFPIVGMLIYCLSLSFGVAIIPTLMLGELFSASIKAKGLTVLAITTALSISLANQTFYYLSSTIGIFAPFLFFGSCNIISAILSIRIVPETKGKTLEEIQQKLKKKKPKNTDNKIIKNGI